MQAFIDFLNLENQKFKCYKSGDREKVISVTIEINNQLGKGATPSEVKALIRLIPNDNSELVELYKIHNGIKLFCNPNDNASGIEFYQISKIKEFNAKNKPFLLSLIEEEPYVYKKHGVVIGVFSNSGNFLWFYKGKIFFEESDEGGEEQESKGILVSAFLDKIVKSPSNILYAGGCYARYYDGETTNQYVPMEFIADKP